jgi:hypothetical protein
MYHGADENGEDGYVERYQREENQEEKENQRTWGYLCTARPSQRTRQPKIHSTIHPILHQKATGRSCQTFTHRTPFTYNT